MSIHPSIIALWHGQFFLLPKIYPREIPGRAIVAKHDDAEALRRILKHFGLGLVRGAGAAHRKRDRGGAEAAHGLIASLREGYSIALTGDIPPGPARKCGVGIVLIASRSGRPIVPFAVATSRYALGEFVEPHDHQPAVLAGSASPWASRSTYRKTPAPQCWRPIANGSRRR